MLNKFREKLFDRKANLQDRLFILLGLIALSGMVFAFFAGIVLGENLESLAATLGGFLILVTTILLGYRFGRLGIAANLIAFLLIFLFFPVVFFTSGGIYGGPPLWFLFCIVFVSMILRGRIRFFMLAGQILMAIICYYVQYRYPEFVIPHDTDEFFLDSLSALIIIGVILSALMMFQIYVYTRENEISNAQTEEIDKLNKAQNRFFSSMSHEIRTPINTIIGLNEMILREEVSAEVAENAENIQAASKMLLSLINDILDMSQMQSGQMQLSPAPYQLSELILDVVTMMQIRAKEKKLDFMVNLSPEIPSGLLGDEVRIKQILINLLNNAIKYTMSGSVVLSLQSVKKQEDDEEINLIFTVMDTGIGIKKESMPYLFSAFKRMDEEKNRHIEGTGLGLSIVKQLLELMGGRVSVNSVYSKGSTFIVELPQKVTDRTPVGEISFAGRSGSESREHYQPSFEAPGGRVLAVDDTPSNLMVVEKLLRATKVQVDLAKSGAEALEKTFQNEYHVILMDHMMPEMDGIECARRIRAQAGGHSREAKIVALTANAGSQERMLYDKEGFDGYLLKPVGTNALENEIRKLLPTELVTARVPEDSPEEGTSWIKSSGKRSNVLITAPSVADLPGELLEKYDLPMIPLKVVTEKGVFRDGIDIDTRAVVSYMKEKGQNAYIMPLSARELEDFFARHLEHANNIILLTASQRMPDSAFLAGQEAARTFENVRVFDSGHVSAGLGLLALEACKMASAGSAPEEILEELEKAKKEVKTTFIVDGVDYLVRSGQLRMSLLVRLTKAFGIRPVIEMKKGRMKVSGVYFGSRKHAWRKFIARALKSPERIERSMLFIGHVGLENKEINEIRTEVARRGVHFDEIFVTQASPVIAANVGPGTFGFALRRRG